MMGGKDVLTGWVQVSRALTMTKGPSVALVSVPQVVSAVCVAVGEAVTPWGAELVEESVVEKVEEGNGIEADEGGLLAMVGGLSHLLSHPFFWPPFTKSFPYCSSIPQPNDHFPRKPGFSE